MCGKAAAMAAMVLLTGMLAAGCKEQPEETRLVEETVETTPHVVFLISEDPANYEAHVTIPPFADMLAEEYDLRTTVLMGEGEQPGFRFPGLEKSLPEADLLVVFFRRSALPVAQLDRIKRFIDEGNPVVGIRTANHAFSLRTIEEGHRPWWEFVSDVLGCENRGYGPDEPGTDVAVVPEAADHPILDGVEPAEWHSPGSLYLVAPLLDEEATVLLTGTVAEAEELDEELAGKVEPVAWTRLAGRSRVFYTSLGYPDDFDMPQFRRLLVNGIFWALGQDAP